MKPTTHTLPSISGQLCLTAPEENSAQETRGDEGTNADDNITVMLASVTTAGRLGTVFDYTSASAITGATGTGANNSRIRHGLFSGLGEGITWSDDTYTGKYSTKEVAIVFDMDNSGTISENDLYYLLKNDNTANPPVNRALRSNETTRDIGKLTASNLITYQAVQP